MQSIPQIFGFVNLQNGCFIIFDQLLVRVYATKKVVTESTTYCVTKHTMFKLTGLPCK